MSKVRLYIIFSLVVLASALFIRQLFILQIRDGDLYRARAQGQQESIQEVHGDRGRIFFSGGEYLATNERRNVIYFSPERVSQDEEIAEFVLDIIGEPLEDLGDHNIIRWTLTDEQLASVRRLNNPLLNQLEEQLIRFYPQDEMAAHVVGFLGGYQSGQYGLEGRYDAQLRGQSGMARTFSFFDLSNREPEFEPEPGDDLHLTLDYNIQFQAERLLQKAKEEMQIEGGTILVSEPKSGRILALANYPSYNPNYYGREELDTFLNPATQKLYEPGSIFKVMTMAAGLNERLITPETTYRDTGSVSVGGPPIHNYRRRVWGEQTMSEVLNKSINTGSVFVQQKLGRELFLKYVDLFGFTQPTGVDLASEEHSSNRVLKDGYARDLATASFGQGIAVTSIQLLTAINAVANDGIMMKPFVVDRRVDGNGGAHVTQPEELGRVIDPRAAAQTTMMMVEVVDDGYGSPGGVESYLIAGKTGTAQIPRPGGGYLDETIHGFAGFGPALNPAFSILVKLDNPRAINSSESAAPIFKELAQYIINYYQIPPDTGE